MAPLKRWQKTLFTLFLLLAALVAYGIWYFETRNAREPSRLAFQEYCASCHGTDLKGSDKAPSLIGRELSLLASKESSRPISDGALSLPFKSVPWQLAQYS